MWKEAAVVKAVLQHLPEELQETTICCGTADRDSNTGLSKYEARFNGFLVERSSKHVEEHDVILLLNK
jgi:hypothetical protein